MAGSSHTLVSSDYSTRIHEIVTTFVADDTTGAIPTLEIAFPYDVELHTLTFDVGGTAPTAATDLTLVDSRGIDRLEGSGANVVGAADTENPIVFASTSIHPIVRSGEPLTLTLANNVVNSATGTIDIKALALR